MAMNRCTGQDLDLRLLCPLHVSFVDCFHCGANTVTYSNIQYSQNTINTPTYLDAKHRAALQKLRDVAQALTVVLGILEDLRKTGRAVGNWESLGSEGLAKVSCTRVHGLADWL